MWLIDPDGAPRALAHYAQGTAVGPLVFVSGQVGLSPEGKLAEGIEAQTRQALANVAAVLRAAGATLRDVASTTVYLTDFANYKGFDAAYREVLGEHRPARATVRADLVVPPLLVEIQAIAFIQRGEA